MAESLGEGPAEVRLHEYGGRTTGNRADDRAPAEGAAREIVRALRRNLAQNPLESACLNSGKPGRETGGHLYAPPSLPARGIQKIVTAVSGTASCEAIGCRVLNALGCRFVVYGVACFAPSAHGLKDDFHRGRSCLSQLHIPSRLSLNSPPLGLQKVLRLLHLTDHLFDFCD